MAKWSALSAPITILRNVSDIGVTTEQTRSTLASQHKHNKSKHRELPSWQSVARPGERSGASHLVVGVGFSCRSLRPRRLVPVYFVPHKPRSEDCSWEREHQTRA